MAPWCRDKFLLQYILRIGDATLIVWTNPQNVLLQNLVHVNIPKPGIWIFSTMKLPVFTKDLFETFQIGVKKMAGSAFCTPKMLKHNHHNSSTRRHHLAPVGLLLGLNRSLNLCRIPLKRVTFPDRLAEQRHPHPLWFDESFMGAPKKRPTNHQWDLILHCFRLIFRHILGTRARQDFQAGEKGRSKTAWNADSKQKWGCQLPPTHLNCELAGKNGVVWGNESSRNGPSGPIRIIMSMDSCSDLCLKSIKPEPTTHFWLYPIDCSNPIFGT